MRHTINRHMYLSFVDSLPYNLRTAEKMTTYSDCTTQPFDHPPRLSWPPPPHLRASSPPGTLTHPARGHQTGWEMDGPLWNVTHLQTGGGGGGMGGRVGGGGPLRHRHPTGVPYWAGRYTLITTQSSVLWIRIIGDIVEKKPKEHEYICHAFRGRLFRSHNKWVVFCIFFNHHSPPENVVYDKRKLYHCRYNFFNRYEL